MVPFDSSWRVSASTVRYEMHCKGDKYSKMTPWLLFHGLFIRNYTNKSICYLLLCALIYALAIVSIWSVI